MHIIDILLIAVIICADAPIIIDNIIAMHRQLTIDSHTSLLPTVPDKLPSIFKYTKSRNTKPYPITRHQSIGNLYKEHRNSYSPIKIREHIFYNPFTAHFKDKLLTNIRCLAQYKSKIGIPGNITLIRLIKS